jgi:hypothetical protein
MSDAAVTRSAQSRALRFGNSFETLLESLRASRGSDSNRALPTLIAGRLAECEEESIASQSSVHLLLSTN